MRRIIQITTGAIHPEYLTCHFIYALCNDGSVWVINEDFDSSGVPSTWTSLPDIPQDEPQTDTEQQPL